MGYPSALLERAVLSSTTKALILDLTTTALGSLQWIQHAGAGTATIDVYVSNRPVGHPDLETLPPAVNPYWSLTPLVWSKYPVGTVDSDNLPFAENGEATMLVLITTTGSVTLSVLAFLSEAQG